MNNLIIAGSSHAPQNVLFWGLIIFDSWLLLYAPLLKMKRDGLAYAAYYRILAMLSLMTSVGPIIIMSMCPSAPEEALPIASIFFFGFIVWHEKKTSPPKIKDSDENAPEQTK